MLTVSSYAGRATFQKPNLIIIAFTNALIIAALYYSQSILPTLWAEHASNSTVALIPASALAGYGVGVLGLTLLRGEMISWKAMTYHLAVLIIALCGAASARDITSLILSHFFLGMGATFVVRATALATWIVPAQQRVLALSIAVGGGLTGLAAARAGAEALSDVLGDWRTGYLLGAAAIALFGATTIRLTSFAAGPAQCEPDKLSILWRTCPSLRAAARQQAASFASFNAAWVAFLLHAGYSTDGPDYWVVFLISATGAVAAMSASWLCKRFESRNLACGGIALASFSAMACFLEIRSGNSPWLWMLLLDAGTQLALVANQSRAQSSAPASRSRLSALITAVGFAGGAGGSLIGQLLAHHASVQSAFLFAALAGSLGIVTGRSRRQSF